jgi:hypothetical protein
MEVLLSVKASTDTRLIGNDYQDIAGLAKRAHRIDGSRKKNKIFPMPDIARIDINNAISVEKNSGGCH